MSDYTEEQVDRVAEAIAKAVGDDYWVDEIAEWENAEEWYREAQPQEFPRMAYDDRQQFRAQALAAIAAAGVAPQPEPEYEYAIQFGSDDEPWSDPSDDPHWLVESTLMSAGDYVARRVKAGSWEPVPIQSDGGS